MSQMFRHITAATLAVTLALPSPARADDLDKAGAVLGLLSLFAIIHLADKSKSEPVQAAPVVRPRPKVHPKPSPRPSRVLPAACVYSNHADRGPRRLLSNRCLRRADVNVHRLPQRCQTWGQNRRGEFKGYRIRCVKREGWVLR